MNIKNEIDKIQALIDKVNEGNAAFWELSEKYSDAVRTKLGKDVSLKYLTCEASLRSALGNDLELAVGEKKVDYVG